MNKIRGVERARTTAATSSVGGCLCGAAQIEIDVPARSLGMSPAIGMAFMLATSATGFPAMAAVWALTPPAFALYFGLTDSREIE